MSAALKRVHKHVDTSQFRDSLQSLMEIDEADLSQSGVDFLLAYMKIVERIPESRIILPFKPRIRHFIGQILSEYQI